MSGIPYPYPSSNSYISQSSRRQQFSLHRTRTTTDRNRVLPIQKSTQQGSCFLILSFPSPLKWILLLLLSGVFFSLFQVYHLHNSLPLVSFPVYSKIFGESESESMIKTKEKGSHFPQGKSNIFSIQMHTDLDTLAETTTSLSNAEGEDKSKVAMEEKVDLEESLASQDKISTKTDENKEIKRILIIHEYTPLQRNHGADNRLLQVMKALASLSNSNNNENKRDHEQKQEREEEEEKEKVVSYEIYFHPFISSLTTNCLETWEKDILNDSNFQHIKDMGIHIIYGFFDDRTMTEGHKPKAEKHVATFVNVMNTSLERDGSTTYSSQTSSLQSTISKLLSVGLPFQQQPDLVITTMWFWTWPLRPHVAYTVAEVITKMNQKRKGNNIKDHIKLITLSDDINSIREKQILASYSRLHYFSSSSSSSMEKEMLPGKLSDKIAKSIKDNNQKYNNEHNQNRNHNKMNTNHNKNNKNKNNNNNLSIEVIYTTPEEKASLLSASEERLVLMKEIEDYVYIQSHEIWVLTPEDADYINLQYSYYIRSPFYPLKNIHVLPYSLENNHDNSDSSNARSSSKSSSSFSSSSSSTSSDADTDMNNYGSNNVCFIGNGLNLTNASGISWFLVEVWKYIQLLSSNTKLILIGNVPINGWGGKTASILQKFYNVRVEGHQSSLEKYFDIMTITGSPSSRNNSNRSGNDRYGRVCTILINPSTEEVGFNTKNLLAPQYGIPLVTTTYGAKGLFSREILLPAKKYNIRQNQLNQQSKENYENEENEENIESKNNEEDKENQLPKEGQRIAEEFTESEEGRLARGHVYDATLTLKNPKPNFERKAASDFGVYINDDPQAIANSLLALLGDKDSLWERSVEGLRQLRKKFSFEKVKEGIKFRLDSLLIEEERQEDYKHYYNRKEQEQKQEQEQDQDQEEEQKQGQKQEQEQQQREKKESKDIFSMPKNIATINYCMKSDP